MKSARAGIVLACFLFAQSAAILSAAEMKVVGLRCEFADNPLGVDTPRPRLSWRLESQRRGARQTSYRVVASSTRDFSPESEPLWDSGKVDSDQSQLLAYGGPALRTSQKVWWRVRAWDEAGSPSGWSEPASFVMGVLSKDEWTARWIVAPWQTESVLMRKTFNLRRGPETRDRTRLRAGPLRDAGQRRQVGRRACYRPAGRSTTAPASTRRTTSRRCCG